MDIALAILPLRIIWNLQMKPKEKIGVGVAMSMAILYVPLISADPVVRGTDCVLERELWRMSRRTS